MNLTASQLDNVLDDTFKGQNLLTSLYTETPRDREIYQPGNRLTADKG
jgi:hypothetical protein